VRTTAEALEALGRDADGPGYDLVLKSHEPGPGGSNAFRLLRRVGCSQHFRTTPVIGAPPAPCAAPARRGSPTPWDAGGRRSA
jgi:hypothetical protein